MAEEQDKTNGGTPPRSKHRSLTSRIVVTGVLELITPAHFGNGDADELTDLPLLVDEVDGRALITGASLAGALRNYLRERRYGYELPMPSRDPQSPYYRDWTATENDLMAATLFGGHRGDDTGDQSPLIVSDALSVEKERPDVELRDGVKIAAETRTAEEKKKYDYQLLRAGTRFNLNFELLLDDKEKGNERRKKALAIALQGLTAQGAACGEIRMGAKKRRGFGCCRVERWTVTCYNLLDRSDMLAWLAADYVEKDKEKKDSPWKPKQEPKQKTGSDVAALLDVTLTKEDLLDRRETFEIEAEFEIEGSLIVRGGFDEQDRGPDVEHLQSRRRGEKQTRPVLPGTSIAGAIRQRALRIANTMAIDDKKAKALINSMFGPEEIKSGDTARASRVLVDEEFINGGHAQVQTRIKIDRFTGGTIESALLEEAPNFGGEVKLRLKLFLIPNNRTEVEIGLLLLVLKDLWLGDLPLGGESSVGRGRLRGVGATLRRNKKEIAKINDEARNGVLSPLGDNTRAELEACVKAFNQWAEGK